MNQLFDKQLKDMSHKMPVFAQMVDGVRIRDESTRKYKELLKVQKKDVN